MILFFIIAFLFQLYVNLFVNIPLIQSFKELFSAFCGFRGANRDRTDNLRLARAALSQLSYSP